MKRPKTFRTLSAPNCSLSSRPKGYGAGSFNEAVDARQKQVRSIWARHLATNPKLALLKSPS